MKRPASATPTSSARACAATRRRPRAVGAMAPMGGGAFVPGGEGGEGGVMEGVVPMAGGAVAMPGAPGGADGGAGAPPADGRRRRRRPRRTRRRRRRRCVRGGDPRGRRLILRSVAAGPSGQR